MAMLTITNYQIMYYWDFPSTDIITLTAVQTKYHLHPKTRCRTKNLQVAKHIRVNLSASCQHRSDLTLKFRDNVFVARLYRSSFPMSHSTLTPGILSPLPHGTSRFADRELYLTVNTSRPQYNMLLKVKFIFPCHEGTHRQ
jgi:hypothetical protein